MNSNVETVFLLSSSLMKFVRYSNYFQDNVDTNVSFFFLYKFIGINESEVTIRQTQTISIIWLLFSRNRLPLINQLSRTFFI